MGLLDRFRGPPSEDKFARLVMSMLKEIGDPRNPTYDKQHFRLQFTQEGGDAGMLNLRNLYEEYCGLDHANRAKMLRKTCVGLAKVMQLPEDFEDARPDLMPTIRPRSMLEVMRYDVELQGGEWSELAAWPLSEHLVVCLVYDLPTTMQFIHREQLDTWGVSLYEAGEVARQNLEERESALASLGDKVYLSVTGDSFDAARILLRDRIRSLKLQGDPVAMALNRESLLITGADDEQGLGILADLAEQKQGEPRPICPLLHRLSGDDWEAWQPPAGSPGFEQFRGLEVRHFGGEYAEQKELMEKRHAQTGEDIFVASFTGLKRGEEVLSYAVWPKGVLTWLPRTDYVALGDPQQGSPRFASWQRLHDVAGHLLSPLDCYPPRWLVEDYPTPEQFDAMGAEAWLK